MSVTNRIPQPLQLSPARKLLRDFTPSTAHRLVALDNYLILLSCPCILLDVRVQVIVPSERLHLDRNHDTTTRGQPFSALLAQTPLQLPRNKAPTRHTVLFY